MTKKVLVIDDSIMIRKMVSGILAGQFDVLEAKDGSSGIEVAKKSLPDLILLDFVMPKMDGYDTMQGIRADERLRSVPIIMMSGLKEQVTARIPEPFVGFDFIEKPFSQELLLARIHDALHMAPAPEPELVAAGAEAGDSQVILNKMTQVETLLIQGIENLVQREVVGRLSVITERVQQQEINASNLAQKLDYLTQLVERQNKGLWLIASELKQMRLILSANQSRSKSD
ncbi:MAG: response regulator [Thermostichales cyanobacterium BF4_bins_65]